MTVQGRSPSHVDVQSTSNGVNEAGQDRIQALVACYPGPAALFDGQGRLLLANALAGPLTDRHEMYLGELGAIISGVSRDRQGQLHRLQTVEGDSDVVLDLAIMPAECDTVLVLGRDSTFDVNLSAALIASRKLFQDLVACSVDFAWETGPDGRFKFVSARGALGYAAAELDGQPARDLLLDDCSNVFESSERVDDREIWLRRADGETACMRVFATPVFDGKGVWLGTRGVCRDITEAKTRDAALAQAREREALVHSVVDTIRSEIAPKEVYRGATEQVASLIGADYAAIVRGDGSGAWYVVAEVCADAVALLNDEFLDGNDRGRLVATQCDGRQQLAAPCRYHDETKGWFCLVWTPDHGEEDHVRELLTAVADHLGIAMAQADVQVKLEQLSRIDELTGLLNRRAFRETAYQRIAHHRRNGRTGALLFLDLDNFKSVNDVRGHQAGDDALRMLARILGGEDNRQSDVVARLGGDEFALWLEETDRDGAIQRAERILQASAELRQFSGAPEKPLSVSIGVVVSHPQRDLSLDALIEQADNAMYQAKRAGKGRIVVVESE